MSRGPEVRKTIRDPSPCIGCTERFLACSDKCPKDARGELGYKTWLAEVNRVKKARKEYIDRVNVRKKIHNGGYHGQE